MVKRKKGLRKQNKRTPTHFGADLGFLPSTTQSWPPVLHRLHLFSFFGNSHFIYHKREKGEKNRHRPLWAKVGIGRAVFEKKRSSRQIWGGLGVKWPSGVKRPKIETPEGVKAIPGEASIEHVRTVGCNRKRVRREKMPNNRGAEYTSVTGFQSHGSGGGNWRFSSRNNNQKNPKKDEWTCKLGLLPHIKLSLPCAWQRLDPPSTKESGSWRVKATKRFLHTISIHITTHQSQTSRKK